MLRSTRVIQLGKLLTKWKERAPDVLDVATAIAVPENNCLSQPRKADAVVPSLCTAVSTLLNTRNGELSIVQKLVSTVLGLKRSEIELFNDRT